MKKGEFANKIAIDTHKYVVNFYPSLSSSPKKSTYTQYCKYALMKYKPWNGCVDEIWGGEDATDDDIQNAWNAFVDSLGDDIPDRLRRELDKYESTRVSGNNEDDAARVERNEEGSFYSGEAAPPQGKTILYKTNRTCNKSLKIGLLMK